MTRTLSTILFTALVACGTDDRRSSPDAAAPAYTPTQVTVLAASELRPNGIVADENAAYFTSSGQPLSLRKLDLKSLAVTTLVPDIGAGTRIAGDADHVYFATGELTGNTSRVVAVDKVSGSTKDLATGQMYARMVVVDDDAVYWEADDATGTIVRSIKKDGTGLRDVSKYPDGQLFDMAGDGSRIYVIGATSLLSIDKQTGAATPLTTAINGFNRNLAEDATSLYISDRNDNTIKKVPKTGGAPVTLASNQMVPGRLAVSDDGTVYWAVRGSNDDGSTMLGALRELPAGATDVVDIATGLDHAIEPTLLSHAVLWTVYGPMGTNASTTASGSVMAAPL